jgi:hypothetical protein
MTMSAQQALEAAGIPWKPDLPEQQFARYASQQFRPGLNFMRNAFYGMQDPLMQQYYLGAPRMEQPFGDFGQFMTQRGRVPDVNPVTGVAPSPWNPYQYSSFAPDTGVAPWYNPEDEAPDWTAPTYTGLGGLARAVSAISGLTPEQFFEYTENPTIGGTGITGQQRDLMAGLSPEQQLLYRRIYGTGEESAANRAALVNLMALQRSPVGGQAQPMYGGMLGQAITGTLNEMYQQLMARDPGSDFLDWYIGRTGGKPGAAGFLTEGPTI